MTKTGGKMAENNTVEWNDRFVLGVPEIDRQHRELVNMANNLFTSCLAGRKRASDSFKRTLRAAAAYVRKHFAEEERIMRKSGYPLYREHRAEHKRFMLELLQQNQAYITGRKYVPNSFARYLKDWILAHIALKDKDWADYVLAKEAADYPLPCAA
jgi:hemerythrin